jgi:hypothetical protein
MAGTVMILPTLAVAIDIARRSWHDRLEFTHNLAVCFWICANAVWMIGEFFFDDSLRRYSAVFFRSGLRGAGLALSAVDGEMDQESCLWRVWPNGLGASL